MVAFGAAGCYSCAVAGPLVSCDLVESNDEDTVTSSGRHHKHFTFDREIVEHILATEPVAPSGAGYLTLPLEHRDVLLG